MTIEIKDGGPAFPCPADDMFSRANGMSLRDWFAGQALACPLLPDVAAAFTDIDLDRHFGRGAVNITRAMRFAAAARDIADAMLAARTPEASNG